MRESRMRESRMREPEIFHVVNINDFLCRLAGRSLVFRCGGGNSCWWR